MPDIAIAILRLSESSNLDSPKDTGARLAFSSGHRSMGVVEARGRSPHKKVKDQMWNEYAEIETGTYIIVHRRKKGR